MLKTSNHFKVDKQSLKKEYAKALKNLKFKQLVSKLKINEDILMKYTSSLEDASDTYDNCLNCKGLIECPYNPLGYAYLPQVNNDNLEFGLVACKYQKVKLKEESHYKNLYLYEMPDEIKKANLKDIYTDDKNRVETIKWIKNFITNYQKNQAQKGLYLNGSFGSGKTYLIAAMFNELAKKGHRSAIVFWPEFLRDLKSSFNTDYKEKFEKIKKVPLLLIDDIGAEVTTEWGRDEIFCPIVQYRMQEKLPTFFTSNLDLESLEKHFSITKDKVSVVKSKRIIERINQMTDKIELISKNLRK